MANGIFYNGTTNIIEITGSTSISGSLSNGVGTIASGLFSQAQGINTIASANFSHAQGSASRAIGIGAHAEGQATLAQGIYSHAEGTGSFAAGTYSHAEGRVTAALGQASHAEGFRSTAKNTGTHAEGLYTIAEGQYQTTVGYYNVVWNVAENITGTAGARPFIVGTGDSDVARQTGFAVQRISPTEATIVLPNIPTSTANVPVGGVWKDTAAGNVLKIV